MQATCASDLDESTFGSINYIKSSGAKLALLGEPSHTVIKCLTPSKTIEKYYEATQSRQEALIVSLDVGATIGPKPCAFQSCSAMVTKKLIISLRLAYSVTSVMKRYGSAKNASCQQAVG